MIVNYEIFVNDLNGVILQGFSAKCGGKIGRYLETGEVKEYLPRIEKVRRGNREFEKELNKTKSCNFSLIFSLSQGKINAEELGFKIFVKSRRPNFMRKETKVRVEKIINY